MALNFPSSPAVDDVYTSGNYSYKFNGSTWVPNRKKYSYKGVANTNVSGTVSLDLSKANFFEVDLSNDTTISFTNPPSSELSQKFYVKVKIRDDYPYTTFDLVNATTQRFTNYTSLPYYANIGAQDTNARTMFVKTDGTKMYILGNATNAIYQYTMSTPWDIGTLTYDSISMGVGSYDSSPRGVAFRPDGLKMFIGGQTNDRIHQFTLSTAWDISTAVYDNVSMYVGAQATAMINISFKTDGSKIYITDSDNSVYQYSGSSNWDLDLAGYDNESFSFASQDATIRSVYFKSDGTKLYVCGNDNAKIYEYTLSTPWLLSSITYSNSLVFPYDYDVRNVVFDPSGRKMLVLGRVSNFIYSFNTVQYSRITWPNSITWEYGITPDKQYPEVGQSDIYMFWTTDGGTTYFGKQVQDNLLT